MPWLSGRGRAWGGRLREWHTQARPAGQPSMFSLPCQTSAGAGISETLEDPKHCTQDLVIFRTTHSYGGELCREIMLLDIWTLHCREMSGTQSKQTRCGGRKSQYNKESAGIGDWLDIEDE